MNILVQINTLTVYSIYREKEEDQDMEPLTITTLFYSQDPLQQKLLMLKDCSPVLTH